MFSADDGSASVVVDETSCLAMRLTTSFRCAEHQNSVLSLGFEWYGTKESTKTDREDIEGFEGIWLWRPVKRIQL